jgi:N-acetylmuramoyl-L-alanine amidase
MGLHKTEASLRVAQKENSAILLEKNYAEMYDGFNPNDPDAYIIFANFQDGLFGHVNQSLKLATLIQEKMGKAVDYRDRKVQQAGFRVLYGLRMPSILTEIGFINNPDEEDFLSSKQGQEKISLALFDAFREYKKSIDNIDVEITAKAGSNETAGTLRATSNNDDNKPAPKPEYVPKKSSSSDTVVFRIQFASYADEIPLSDKRFAKIENCWKYNHTGQYRYTSGCFNSMSDAYEHLQKMKKNSNYSDAFIVAFLNGQRITTGEAISILNSK